MRAAFDPHRKKGNTYRILVGKREEKRPLGIPRHKRRIILKWILKKEDGGTWTGFMWIRIGTSEGLL
jgi:hypothetical protein